MSVYIFPTDNGYGLGCPIGESDSYQKIYNLKNRPYEKPLAILIPDYDWLYDNTSLTEEQLDFLSEYKKPFIILTDCPRISLLLDYSDDEISYENNTIYKHIAFRVAHNNSQKQLLDEVGPLFITSANTSGSEKNYSISDIQNNFGKKLDKNIKILGDTILDKQEESLDIFSFVGDSLEKKFVGKN